MPRRAAKAKNQDGNRVVDRPLTPVASPVKQAALDHGALGSSISGAGPSVFGWFVDGDAAQAAARAMQAAFAAAGLGSDVVISAVNCAGARVV